MSFFSFLKEDTFVGSENQVRKMSTSTKLNPSSEERLRAALEEKDLYEKLFYEACLVLKKSSRCCCFTGIKFTV